MKKFCHSLTAYQRMKTRKIMVGELSIGGDFPIRLQSMTTSDTMDTEKSVTESIKIIEAGAELVRLTAPSIKEAYNLANIKKKLNALGYNTPLVADIHFTPNAAEVAAKIVEKVRVNLGNYVDKKKFENIIYTDDSYQDELNRIEEKFSPLVKICKEEGIAMRIGTNHGSLSDRILSRYGDTPKGMVESAMEFLRICRKNDYHEIVLSMKARNTRVMVQAYRLLVAEMNAEGMDYRLQLGVTEAGDGEDGRMKSAVGIGALLEDGLGDTIRVSLSEEPEAEVPVARKLVDYVSQRTGHQLIEGEPYPGFSPYSMDKRQTHPVWNIGGEHLPVVISDRSKITDMAINTHFIPDYIYVGSRVPDNFPKGMKSIVDYPGWEDRIDNFPLFTVESLEKMGDCNAPVKFLRMSYPELTDELISFLKVTPKVVVILTTKHQNGVGEQRAFFHKLLNADCHVPVILQREYAEDEAENIQLKGGVDFGTVLLDGFGNGIMISNEGAIDIEEMDSYAFGLLQAARVRTSKTEFISCPSCGRTLFDLQTTVAMIKKHFSHLKHLKIGVMGCIVNGPGEMADADYGYVGAEHGKISLYRKKELVEKNIPQAEAVEHLIQLIKDHGDWIEPEDN